MLLESIYRELRTSLYLRVWIIALPTFTLIPLRQYKQCFTLTTKATVSQLTQTTEKVFYDQHESISDKGNTWGYFMRKIWLPFPKPRKAGK